MESISHVNTCLNVLEFLNGYINHQNKESEQKTEINEIQLLIILITGPLRFDICYSLLAQVLLNKIF